MTYSKDDDAGAWKATSLLPPRIDLNLWNAFLVAVLCLVTLAIISFAGIDA